MPINIAIPTFDRINIFRTHTYNKIIKVYKLEKYITLFIQSNKDAKEYKEAFPKLKQVRSPKGYVNTLNFISKHYPLNAKIVKMDDDITQVLHLVDGKLIKVSSVYGLLNKTFGIMKNVGASLGGYYPTPNAKFMGERKPITTDLRFVIGALYCYVNKRIHLNIEGKTDFQFTIENYKRDGKVVRLNDYSMRYNIGYNTEIAGKHTEAFLKRYGEYVSKVIKHKKGSSSFILKKNPHKKSNDTTDE